MRTGKPMVPMATVWALPGRLSDLSIFHSKSLLYGAIVLVWVWWALNSPKRRFAARADCKSCAAGKYSNAGHSAAVCIACVAGRYALAAAATCTSCPQGRYHKGTAGQGVWLLDANDADGCEDCAVGKTTASTSTAAATDAAACPTTCPAGSYKILSGAVHGCTLCPIGTYNNDAASAAGKHDGLDDCIACAVGERGPGAGGGFRGSLALPWALFLRTSTPSMRGYSVRRPTRPHPVVELPG